MSLNDINTTIDESAVPLSSSTDQVAELSKEFLSLSAKSVEATLAMAKVVCTAGALGNGKFARFCKLIGYDAESSSIRKLKMIGQKHAFFAHHQNDLPSAWTTLYTLSQLAESELETAFEKKQIKQSSTVNELNDLLPTLKAKKTARANNTAQQSANSPPAVPNGTGYDTLFSFPLSPKPEQLHKLHEFIDWLRSEAIPVQVDYALETLLESSLGAPSASSENIRQSDVEEG